MRGGRDDLQMVMDETRKGMARKARRPLDLEHPSLAEFCRRTGSARQRVRTIKRSGSGRSLTGFAAGVRRLPCPAATPALLMISPGGARQLAGRV